MGRVGAAQGTIIGSCRCRGSMNKGQPKRIQVDGCSGCPFYHSGDGRSGSYDDCVLDDAVVPIYGYGNDGKAPTGCPLRGGSVEHFLVSTG
jgi:hypothetical protein